VRRTDQADGPPISASARPATNPAPRHPADTRHRAGPHTQHRPHHVTYAQRRANERPRVCGGRRGVGGLVRRGDGDRGPRGGGQIGASAASPNMVTEAKNACVGSTSAQPPGRTVYRKPRNPPHTPAPRRYARRTGFTAQDAGVTAVPRRTLGSRHPVPP